MNPIRHKRQLLRQESSKYNLSFVELPRVSDDPRAPIRAWRNRYFLAALYLEHGRQRLSINSAEIDSSGDWKDGITWDQLQAIKSAVGFGDKMAVEIFPEDKHIVYDHNIRHLWILDERLPWAWTSENAANDGCSDTADIEP